MENLIDRIDPKAEIEVLQEQTPTVLEKDPREDHLLRPIATTLVQEIVLLGAEYHHIDAHLRETIIEQDPHLEPEVRQEGILLEEMMIGETGLGRGRQGMTGINIKTHIQTA